MEDINDSEYSNAKRACQDFKIKQSGEYHDLHVS